MAAPGEAPTDGGPGSTEATSDEKRVAAPGGAPAGGGPGSTEATSDEKFQPFTGTIYELMEEYGFQEHSKFPVGIKDLILICLQARECPSGKITHVV